MEEAEERRLEGLMMERRKREAALNRALAELLGSGRGGAAAVTAIEEMEAVLRSIAALVSSLEA